MDATSTAVATPSSSDAITAAAPAPRFAASYLFVSQSCFFGSPHFFRPLHAFTPIYTLQDKAVKRFLIKNMVEQAAVRDLAEASVFDSLLRWRLRCGSCSLSCRSCLLFLLLLLLLLLQISLSHSILLVPDLTHMQPMSSPRSTTSSNRASAARSTPSRCAAALPLDARTARLLLASARRCVPTRSSLGAPLHRPLIFPRTIFSCSAAR
jgi:hypothetical protein